MLRKPRRTRRRVRTSTAKRAAPTNINLTATKRAAYSSLDPWREGRGDVALDGVVPDAPGEFAKIRHADPGARFSQTSSRAFTTLVSRASGAPATENAAAVLPKMSTGSGQVVA